MRLHFRNHFILAFREELLESDGRRLERFNLLTLHLWLFVAFLLFSRQREISFLASNRVVTLVASLEDHSHWLVDIKVTVICGFNLVIVRDVLVQTISDFAILNTIV